MYNTLVCVAICPYCQISGSFEIQFKFGSPRARPYVIGDELTWLEGAPSHTGHTRVLAFGLGDCPNCEKTLLPFDVWFHRGRIEEVGIAPNDHVPYAVLEPRAASPLQLHDDWSQKAYRLESPHNSVLTRLRCPGAGCGVEETFEVQFAYGELGGFRYQCGDRIRWSGRREFDIGRPDFEVVVASGMAAPCSACSSTIDFDVWIRGGFLDRIVPCPGLKHRQFIVVEP